MYRGIHCAGFKAQHILFRGNLIDSPGENGVYIESTANGTGVYDTNAVWNSNPGFALIVDNSANYEALGVESSPYYGWRFEHFTAGDFADMAVVGDTADPEGDGRSNTAEYALGGDPKTADSAETEPILSIDGGRLVLSYFRPDGRGDTIYEVESAADLQKWLGPLETSGILEAPISTPVEGGTLKQVRTVDAVTQSQPPFPSLKLRRK